LNFNIYNSLILAGVIQGIIFGIVVLASKKYRSESTYFLIGVILCCVYSNLQYYLRDVGILSQNQMFSTIFLPIAALFSVLIYYYVSKYLYPLDKLTYKDKLLLIPSIFFTLLIIPYKIGVLIGYQNESYYYSYLFYSNFLELTSVPMLLFLLILSYKKILKYEKKNTPYDIDKITHPLNWLKKTLMVFFILSIIWGVFVVRFVILGYHNQSFYLLWLSISFVTYWLGYIGIYKYGVSEQRKKIRIFTNKKITDIIYATANNKHIKDLEKLLIQKKQFLNPALTQEVVAKKLNLSKSHLSRIINSELDTSFTNYLNSLRVEQAKQYIENESFTNYTIAAIGLEAGFNSKSTFNKAFKKVTGLTPSGYKKELSRKLVRS